MADKVYRKWLRRQQQLRQTMQNSAIILTQQGIKFNCTKS
ncbi:hypothetical protein CHY_2243 [Carboxydothermus hydrogenoformans Z-2901]|uniref:Uncharacterized protein n=1 Tax=Carboxydothermus hydrogenoformans (strain ATCC BAA-161 / DSM 6008 / Z-2901) TaxID=246194 RepID=Q3A9Y2_CARHZ|nr:hypothetical protein CHY_2243 [Carboxydothermus hydrogenoformans Z-2901]